MPGRRSQYRRRPAREGQRAECDDPIRPSFHFVTSVESGTQPLFHSGQSTKSRTLWVKSEVFNGPALVSRAATLEMTHVAARRHRFARRTPHAPPTPASPNAAASVCQAWDPSEV